MNNNIIFKLSTRDFPENPEILTFILMFPVSAQFRPQAPIVFLVSRALAFAFDSIPKFLLNMQVNTYGA